MSVDEATVLLCLQDLFPMHFELKFKRVDLTVHSSLLFSEKETDHMITWIGY